MILKSIEYSEYDGTPNEWRLRNCSLDTINLIVGENASGKSKILNIIGNLGSLLSGERPAFRSANFKVGFDNDGTKLNYVLVCDKGSVIKERLDIGRRNLLSRSGDGAGEIYYQRLKRKLHFQVPPLQVASVARRDSIQHPFLDDLNHWGDGVRHYYFGTDMGISSFGLPMREQEGQLLPKAIFRMPQMVVPAFIDGQKRFGAHFVKSIIEDMGRIGYELTDIFTSPPFGLDNLPEPTLALHVKEADLAGSTSQNNMSQGMFRALALIIQITYTQLADSPACILIDDIGEGLDYKRSTALVNLLIDRVKGTTTQLIMASNDRFVMNTIPLTYWSVVQRLGNLSRMMNQRNSPQLFKDFELTGLNNFDFFSTKYYLKERKQN